MTIGIIEKRINAKCKYYENDFFKTNKGLAIKIVDEYGNYSERLISKMDIESLIKLFLADRNSYSPAYDEMIVFLSKTKITHLLYACDLVLNEKEACSVLLENDEKATNYLIGKVKEIMTDDDYGFADYFFKNFKKAYDLLSNVDLELLFNIIRIRSVYGVFSKIKMDIPVFISDNAGQLNTKKNIQKFKELYESISKRAGNTTCKSIDNKLKSYKRLLSSLRFEVKKDEIVDSIALAEKIDDDSIKDDVLTFIFEHNMEYWKKLEKEYNEKMTNSIESFTFYFFKLGLNFNSIPDGLKKKIMEDNIDVVKEKVEIIKRFADNNSIFEILANISMDNLLLLNLFLNKQYITSDFISKNVSTLLNVSSFDTLKNNIEFLESEISFKRFSDLSFLLVDNTIIRNNIALLTKYGIPFKNARNLSFIKTPIIDKLCAFVEVGLESTIMTNPDILNVDIDLAKRVLLIKEIGEDIYVDGKLDELVIYKSSFFASEKEVNNFALTRDNSKYNGEGKIYLSNTDSTSLSYVVTSDDDGEEVLIPKMRVTSQPESLQKIIEKSLYSKKQIETLKKNSI